jgi:hypothetical protein
MNKQLLKSILLLVILSLIGFVLNKAILYLIFPKENYCFSLPTYFITFTIIAALLVTILFFIGKRELMYVGYSFLWFTVLQMTICGILVKTILLSISKTERINFFIICLYYLAIETFLSIKILNKPQSEDETNKKG